jgi:hypothetical protein
MKNIKIAFAILAITLALTSSFTAASKKSVYYIWFKVNINGTLDASQPNGSLAQIAGCGDGLDMCSKAFRYDDQVPSNSQVEIISGSFRVKSTVNVHSDFVGVAYKF